MRKTLDNIAVFARLTPERREAVVNRCSWRDVAAGAMVVAHEDTSRAVHFLVSGRARSLVYAAKGTMVGFGDITAGAMFGEVQAIDGQPRSVAVEAVEACTVASLPAEAFLELVRQEPDFAVTVLEQIARNIRALTARVFEFSTMPVSSRLHAELLRQARSVGQPVAGGIRLATVGTHAELAARISTHREAVTRELNRLTKIGVLTKDADKALVIAKLEILQAMVREAVEAG